MPSQTFFLAEWFNKKGGKGFLFNDLDLPTIYRLAQHTFGRDFISLSVKGITVRECVDVKKLKKFVGLMTELYNPTRERKPVSLNLSPIEAGPVMVARKKHNTAYHMKGS